MTDRRAKEILEFPFEIQREEFYQKIRLETCVDCKQAVDRLISDALPVIRPQAVYRVCDVIDRYDDSVTVENTVFYSRVLSENLTGVHRIFAYVVTSGRSAEILTSSSDDFMASYWIDALKELALECAHESLRLYLEKKYHSDELSSMNPGSGDVDLWPITEQPKLFELIGDVERDVGVTLTESCLMVPAKSLSGLFFPSDVKFINCQRCSRSNCPGRKADYIG